MSVRQADHVSALLEERGDAWNTPWSGAAAVVRPGSPPHQIAGGLRITLLSPDESSLEQLGRTWEKEMQRLGLSGRKPGTTRTRAKTEDSESEPNELEAARVLISYRKADRHWADRIARGLRKLELSIDLSVDEALPIGESWEDSIRDQLERASAVVLLVSGDHLDSEYSRRGLEEILAKRDFAGTRIVPVLVTELDAPLNVLEDVQLANPGGKPLDRLDPKEEAELIRRIANAIATEPSLRRRRYRSDFDRGRPDVERLAEGPFDPDTSVVNSSSLALLAEIGSTALLLGGDAHASTLVRSIGALLRERGLARLPLGAFVVPHGGSRHNLSRELLELLDCDKYLFSNSGAKFRRPDREAVARILAYGRPSANVALTLVFNYRSPTTEIWDDPELQHRYQYRAVYPEPGTEGIRVEI